MLVTGGGGGIGRATALAFACEGADVVLADVDPDALADAAREIREAVRERAAVLATHRVDVADADAVRALAEAVRAEHGVPDVVVNNAGVGAVGSVVDTGLDEWRRVVDVNLWGVVHGSRVFGGLLRERGEGGHVVNVASMAAYLPNAILPVYATTKAAVLSLTESLRAELAGHGIGVSAVCPGFVATGIVESTVFAGADATESGRRRARARRLYGARNFPPSRVAEDILRAVERDLPLVPSTPEAKVALVLSRVAPGLVRAAARTRRP